MVTSRLLRRHTTRTAGGVLAIAAAAVMVPTTPAAAAPARPDIAVTSVTSLPFSTVLPGADFSVVAFVENIGGDASTPVTVFLTGPASVSALTGVEPGPSWTCTYAEPTWRCEHAPLAAGEVAAPLELSYQAETAVPGDVLTFTAAATPAPREEQVANNVGQANVTVVAPGVIRGTLWVDTNRDGQRQPDEPRVSSDTPGMISITASPRTNPDGTQPHIGHAVAQADGTYSMTLGPGNYALLVEVDRQVFRFTTPDVGDDATDSDLDDFQSAPLVNAGLKDLSLASGGVAVIDAGLVPVT